MTQITRQYESIIIVNSSLHEDTLNRIIKRAEDIITKNDGKVVETERWGKRRLAYPIKKFQYGFYIIFHIEASTGLIAELEREYRLNENILRFMTLVKDKAAITAYLKRKEQQKLIAKAAETEPETVQAEPDKQEEPVTAEAPGAESTDLAEAQSGETESYDESVAVEDEPAEEKEAPVPEIDENVTAEEIDTAEEPDISADAVPDAEPEPAEATEEPAPADDVPDKDNEHVSTEPESESASEHDEK